MGTTQEACRLAELEGLSYREAKWVVESNLFLDEYPQWNLGSPHRSVILHEMFLHVESQGRKEVECMCHQGRRGCMRKPSSKEDQSALHLIDYHTSRKELRDVYYSIYNLNRVSGFPSCGKVKRVKVIWEILSSLQERLQRWAPSAEAKVAPENEMDLVHPPAYEVALQDVHCKVTQTAASLQDDLDRLDSKLRGRSRTQSPDMTRCRTRSRSWHRGRSRRQSGTRSGSCHSAQTRSLPWEHTRGISEGRIRTQSQDCHQVVPPSE